MSESSNKLPKGVRLLEHTADVGIQVQAHTLESLFVRAAEGMFSIMLESQRSGAVQNKSVSVTGRDQEELLVNWLSELNFLAQSEFCVPIRYHISAMSATKLVATIEAGLLTANQFNTEIKAVTYHLLTVYSRNDQWFARIIFDI